MMDIDELLEEELKKNEELKKVFDKYPERKELYKQKILDTWDARTGFTEPESKKRARQCETCMFAEKREPFGKIPKIAYCGIYEKANSSGKPDEVYFDGAECEYYEAE